MSMKQLLTLTLLVACAFGTSAAAHSALKSSTPAQGAVLTVAPTEITMTFDSAIRVTAARMAQGALDLPKQSGFEDTITLPLPTLDTGAHRLEWRGLSSDGHTVIGAVEFSVK